MIGNFNEQDALKFKTLSKTEKLQKGILGRLYGPIADCLNATRNGRKYSEKLWENVFSSEITKEKFENGGVMGELCHPDYDEVDMEKAAVIMPEPPKKDKSGKLIAYLDILDTPCGKIAYQLAKYGYKFGISSRGQGDLVDDYGSNEELVDPNTYILNAFDLVEIPAVKSARLSFVESYDKKSKKTLGESLREEIDSTEDDHEKTIMKEKLCELNVDLNEDLEDSYGSNLLNLGMDIFNIDSQEVMDEIDDYFEDQQEKSEENLEQDDDDKIPLREDTDDDTDMLVDSIEEKVDALYDDIITLKDDAELDEYPVLAQFLKGVSDILDGYDSATDSLGSYEISGSDVGDAKFKDNFMTEGDDLVTTLRETLKKLRIEESKNAELQEKISVCNAKEDGNIDSARQLENFKNANSINVARIKFLREKLNSKATLISKTNKLLNESTDQLTKLSEKFDQVNSRYKKSKQMLEKLSNDLDFYKSKLNESQQLLEKYRKSYSSLKEQYITSKAEAYGVDKYAVTQKLRESNNKKSVDRICEDLRQNNLDLEKLPFTLNKSTIVSYSGEPNQINYSQYNQDDDIVSDSLLRMTNL